MLVVERAGPGDMEACLAVRHQAFVVEQGVTHEEEVDGLDPECVHLVARLDGRVVGTARLREHRGAAKAERVAVLREHRGRGVGTALLEALEREAARLGHRRVRLASQLEAIPFYEGLGYRAEGPVFLDARIEHRWMEREIATGSTPG